MFCNHKRFLSYEGKPPKLMVPHFIRTLPKVIEGNILHFSAGLVYNILAVCWLHQYCLCRNLHLRIRCHLSQKFWNSAGVDAEKGEGWVGGGTKPFFFFVQFLSESDFFSTSCQRAAPKQKTFCRPIDTRGPSTWSVARRWNIFS